jgi:hypothetical protein
MAAEPYPAGSAGLFAGMNLGGERPAFEAGFNLTLAVGYSHQRGDQPFAGYGAFLQFGFSRTHRFSIGGLGGVAARDGLELIGETGLTVDMHKRCGLHTGLIANAMNGGLYGRQQWFLDQLGVGTAVQTGPFLGRGYQPPKSGGVTPGRPFRDGEGQVTARATDRDGESSDAARAWQHDADHEAESVPAFLQLAFELSVSGAPPCLVARAIQAAHDEVSHAGLCAEVAAAIARTRLRPVARAFQFRQPLFGTAALERLAVESALDGWIGEGQNAAIAEANAAASHNAAIARVERQIAREEAQHAELGREIVIWTLAAGGQPVQRALRRALAEAQASLPEGSALAHVPGKLRAEQRRKLAVERREHVQRDLSRLL